ncbi:TPA: hypothetical protein HA278_00290 [Candidatus Woesearchaeota archaeon]|nr:hypothetical protein [archaeon]HIJ10467.1 hypothetical protein [Candidatus Woesearchaeota archaeon]
MVDLNLSEEISHAAREYRFCAVVGATYREGMLGTTKSVIGLRERCRFLGRRVTVDTGAVCLDVYSSPKEELRFLVRTGLHDATLLHDAVTNIRREGNLDESTLQILLLAYQQGTKPWNGQRLRRIIARTSNGRSSMESKLSEEYLRNTRRIKSAVGFAYVHALLEAELGDEGFVIEHADHGNFFSPFVVAGREHRFNAFLNRYKPPKRQQRLTNAT